MSKYIDADGIMRACYDSFLKTNNKAYAEIISLVAVAPAADVQEVRHGRWEEHLINNIYCEGGVAIRLTCPVCGECFTVTREARPRERFCRWCGAKMDEVEDNG